MPNTLLSSTQMSANLPSEDFTQWDHEVNKLGVRQRERQRTWIVQWRVDGRTRKQTLGRFEDMSQDDARLLARAILGAKTQGGNPAKRSRQTVAAFGEAFLLNGAAGWKPATLKGHSYVVRKLINPYFGTHKIAELTRDDVVAWMRRLTCAEGSANRALAVLSGMMRHAEVLGLRVPDSNPCKGMRRRKSAFKATYLDAQGWAFLGHSLIALASKFPSEIGCIKFLALTGCRRGEATGLMWGNIEGPRAALPDAKSGPRAIWLGLPAKRLLASFPKTNTYVFGTGDKQLSEGRLNKVWHMVRQEAGLAKLSVIK